jgi:hypothetical protein
MNKKCTTEKVFTRRGEIQFYDVRRPVVGGEQEVYHYSKYEDPLLKEYVKKAFDVTNMYDYGS